MGRRMMRWCKMMRSFGRGADFRVFFVLGCILVGAVLLTGCTNVLLDAINEDLMVKATLSPQSGMLITGHENITVTFEESMDTETLELSGSLGEASGEWTSKTALVVKPKTVWNAGSGRTLNIECESGGNLSTYALTYDVFHGVCVSSSKGDNSNPGGTTAPKKTIQAGIDAAYSLYGTGVVRVAGGTYQVDYRTTDAPVMNMKEGISVYGGYSENNWETQNTADNETIVEDTSTEGGSASDPNRAVYCDDTITSSTKIGGFTIKLGNGDANAGIFCEGAPTITNNKIQGRDQSGANAIRAYGISILNLSPSILNNTIDAGYGNGTGDFTYGIYLDNSDASIKNNEISGGKGSTSYGIYNISNSSPEITYNNSIDCGEGTGELHAYCIYIHNNCHPKIENNTLTNSGADNPYGIFEFASTSDPQTVQNNHFNLGMLGGGGLYYDFGNLNNPIDSLNITISTQQGNDTLANWGNTANLL